MTLIELVVAIVVVSIAVIGMLALLSSIASHSADALVRTQSTAIARAYLDEVLGAQFTSDGVLGNRAAFNDIQDYALNPDQQPRMRDGTAMTGVAQYRVIVQTANATIAGVAGAQIIVRVTSPTGSITELRGFRTNHAAQILY
jgi:MSHA pilin protein MshD